MNELKNELNHELHLSQFERDLIDHACKKALADLKSESLTSVGLTIFQAFLGLFDTCTSDEKLVPFLKALFASKPIKFDDFNVERLNDKSVVSDFENLQELINFDSDANFIVSSLKNFEQEALAQIFEGFLMSFLNHEFMLSCLIENDVESLEKPKS